MPVFWKLYSFNTGDNTVPKPTKQPKKQDAIWSCPYNLVMVSLPITYNFL